MLKEVTMLRSERPVIHTDPSPPAWRPPSPREKVLREMARGAWIQVTRAEAKRYKEACRAMGGESMIYRLSEASWCFKVLEAPWIEIVGKDAAA